MNQSLSRAKLISNNSQGSTASIKLDLPGAPWLLALSLRWPLG